MADPYADLILEPQGDEGLRVPLQESPNHRSGLGSWTEYLLLRAVLGLGDSLPDRLGRAWMRALAAVARRIDRRHSDAARDFIRTALPDAPPARVEQLVVGAWRNLCRLHQESRFVATLPGERLGDHYQVQACPGLPELLGSGSGCLLVTAHVGVWEALALPLGALGIEPFYAIGKPPHNLPLARHIERTRRSAGGHMLPRRGAMKAVPKVLRGGGAVLMLLDHRARTKPIVAPLFGRPAACDRTAGVLMRRVRAPLVFLACYRQGGSRRYRLVFSRIVTPEQLSGRSPEEIIALVNRETERLILACPEQYFWLHDRYKGVSPAGGDAATPGVTEHPAEQTA